MADRTLVLLKPDAVERGLIGEIIRRFEAKGLTIVAMDLRRLDEATLARHYEEHQSKPFYADLVRFMTSGPIVLQVLEGENAIQRYRDVMGATDPAKAASGTIRKEFAESIERNTVHGSDSVENAKLEIGLTFKPEEIVG